MSDKILAPVVLVVEDEGLIRLEMSFVLGDLGLEVVEAASADEALRYLQTVAVDAVVTDVRMPGRIDGLDLARILRKDFPDVVVFMLSGHVRANAAPEGVTIMQKPCDLALLGARLRKAIEAKAVKG